MNRCHPGPGPVPQSLAERAVREELTAEQCGGYHPETLETWRGCVELLRLWAMPPPEGAGDPVAAWLLGDGQRRRDIVPLVLDYAIHGDHPEAAVEVSA